jgi:hypothetical protein
MKAEKVISVMRKMVCCYLTVQVIGDSDYGESVRVTL